MLRGDVRGTLAEREHRCVDLFLDMRQSEQPRHDGHVAARHRITERLDVPTLQVLDQHRPRVEAGVAGNRELRVSELKRPRDASVRADGCQAPEGGRIAAPGLAQQILGELVLLFEVGGNVRMLVGHRRPPSRTPVSASWAEERSRDEVQPAT